MYPAGMLDRLWWFVSGLVAGGVLTVRALGRRPSRRELSRVAARTGAQALTLVARGLRPAGRNVIGSRR